MTHRTRIKICGLTRSQDVAAVVAAGADAVGFVFYPPSPRYVSAAAAAALVATVPPFVSTVGLFVNATVDEVAAVLAQAPLSLLQFHGDETPEQCAAIAHAVHGAIGITEEYDLQIYTLIDVPHINQVHVFYRAELIDLDFRAGEESLEVQLFEEAQIPWSELAFRTVARTLECYFADRRKQEFPVRSEAVQPFVPPAKRPQ